MDLLEHNLEFMTQSQSMKHPQEDKFLDLFASDSHDTENDPKLSDLLRLIECPRCKNTPSPPIFNCENGHAICGQCRPRLQCNRCVYCLGPFTTMRNYPLETLVTTPVAPCPFIQFGCRREKLTLLEYQEHLEKCWGKFWRPGKVSTFSHKSLKLHLSPISEQGHFQECSPCSTCGHANSKRKVKCGGCEGALRPPTPNTTTPTSTITQHFKALY